MVGKIKPKIPVRRMESMVYGIIKAMIVFAGIDTIEKTPVRYKRSGKTEIEAATVETIISLSPIRVGINLNYLVIFRVTIKTPAVAIKDN